MSFSKQDNHYEQRLKEYIADVVPKDEVLVDAPETQMEVQNGVEITAQNFSGEKAEDFSCEKAVVEKKPHVGIGHRARLMKKAKREPLSDAELLELLLFYAVPRRNTSDIAHEILGISGSIQEALRTPPEKLKRINGVGENVALFIKCLHDLCARCEVEPPKRQPLTVKVTYAEFWTLLDGIYRHETKEVVDVYLLDSTSKIFACQRLAEGEVSSVEFTANALAKIIIDDSPAGLFIVHNHPHGTTKPSKADKQVTKKCQLLCSLHNVMFCDHIIYARGQIYSYYESGKMQPISMNFAVKTVLEKEEEENGV